MPSAGARAAPGGHLDQRIGPALSRRHGPARRSEACGPVAPGPRRSRPRTARAPSRFSSPETMEPEIGSRVIWPSHMPRDARLEIHGARRPAVLVGGVGALGVGQLLPVGQGPVEVLEAHRAPPGRRASPRPGPWTPRCGGGGPTAIARAWSAPIRPSRQASAQRGRWRSVRPRRIRRRAALRGTPAPGGDPRRRRLGPVGRPLLARLEGGGGLGDECLEASELVVEHLDRRAVAVVPGAARHQRVERLGEVIQLHVTMQARGCDKAAAVRPPEPSRQHRRGGSLMTRRPPTPRPCRSCSWRR